MNYTQTYENLSSCTWTLDIKTEVKFYNLSSNNSYHYEYRYELNKNKSSSSESRLILLLAGRYRTCIDWWDLSAGESVLSHMRSSGFSILAICTPRNEYEASIPIQHNLDAYWIYTTLQMWMNDVYYKHFKHYPRLYLFGVSAGTRMSSILSRVLPVQAQILYIGPGYQPSFFIHSDYEKAMQTRLSMDYTFANWFYFDYCLKSNITKHKQCPFDQPNKNYFNPVPPTYFIHYNNDVVYNLPEYNDIILNLTKDAINLGGTLLTHKNALKLYVVYPNRVTPDYMRKNFNRWTCKPWSSQFFYEHFINSTYKTDNKTLQTCWCNPTDFLYLDRYPNITTTWSKIKQENYRDYVRDIKSLKDNFCETFCGQLLARHSISSHHIKNTLSWLNDMDHQRSLYKIQDFLHKPLRLWIYNKSRVITGPAKPVRSGPVSDRTGG